jgi:phosphonate transport system substrate-binding protein
VADTPADSKQWLNPATLIFSYTPVEDPEVYRKVWESFLRHLEKATGKKTQFFAVQSNAAQVEAMRAGRLHIAGVASGSNPIAVNCAGFVPFATMTSHQGEFGYEMEIITHADSPIKKIATCAAAPGVYRSELEPVQGHRLCCARSLAGRGQGFKTAFSGATIGHRRC